MEVGIAYAMWAALGETAIVIVAALFPRGSLTPTGVIGVVLLVAGVLILNLGGAH
ncbi:hypothetical protein Ntsu_40970 [Nocardia sp. IFM 10818]